MKRKIILASTSPRRHTLLKKVVEEFSVCAPTLAEEVLDPTLALPQALEKLAREKAMSVAKTVPEALVIGADTIVCKDGKRLGKPQDETEARAMLRDLSDATHEVITAVAMVCVESNTVVTNHYVSEVTFRALTEEDIGVYIATGEPMDRGGHLCTESSGRKKVSSLFSFHFLHAARTRCGHWLLSTSVDLQMFPGLHAGF